MLGLDQGVDSRRIGQVRVFVWVLQAARRCLRNVLAVSSILEWSSGVKPGELLVVSTGGLQEANIAIAVGIVTSTRLTCKALSLAEFPHPYKTVMARLKLNL